ncbi:hypothetical protein LLG96_04850 [bacterium]|nr:hypothetical protein [bacterium]
MVFRPGRYCALLFAAAVLLIGVSCNSTVNDGVPGGSGITYDFRFSTNTEEWTQGFADYPVGKFMSSYYELTFLYAQLPEYLGRSMYGLYISSNDHSADIFMYIKHELTGLKPNTAYDIVFRVEIASEALESDAGGAGVYLKAGAAVNEPFSIIEGEYYRMNIDKGDQAAGGKDALVLGPIGIPEHTTDEPFRLKTFENSAPFVVTTDSTGVLWVIVGTDSGYVGITDIYYSSIKITLTEQKQLVEL